MLGVVLRATDVLEVPGQATVVVLFSFLLGFQALSTGILGLYVAQVLTEVKRRPLFAVAETLGLAADHEPPRRDCTGMTTTTPLSNHVSAGGYGDSTCSRGPIGG